MPKSVMLRRYAIKTIFSMTKFSTHESILTLTRYHAKPLSRKKFSILLTPSQNCSQGTARVILTQPFSSSAPPNPLPALTMTLYCFSPYTTVASSSQDFAPLTNLAKTTKLAFAGRNSIPRRVKV